LEEDTGQTPDEQPPADTPPASDSSSPPETAGAAATGGGGYRVALDTYNGPLDLLLYLIRKEEVDINDIPIARITEQYQRHLELLAEINVNVAGEFLVMASTLMEIKSRMLLPAEQGLEDEEEEDPRAELVRQLLEYKRFKDLARELGARAAERALKFGRPGAEAPAGVVEPDGESESDEADALEGVGLWELIDAFARVLSETSLGPPQTQVLRRQRPVREFRRELLRIVTAEGRVEFSRVFAGCRVRDDMIATFIALLELVRLGRLCVQQAGDLGEIYVALRDGAEAVGAAAAEVAASEATPPPSQAAPRPTAFRQVDVLAELEEEGEALGRARERIDAAIKSAEAFLKEHHRRARADEAGGPDGEPPSPPPAGPGAAPAPPEHAVKPPPPGNEAAPGDPHDE